MSQFDQPQQQFSDYNEPMPGEKRSNPLGIVGFVLSLTCLLSPIGALISFFAMFKRPRGFAIAGLLIGLLLSALAGGGTFLVLAFFKPAQMLSQSTLARLSAEGARSADGAYPADVSAISVWSEIGNDVWGAPYSYRVVDGGENAVLVSNGPDGLPGTPDDVEMDFLYHSGFEFAVAAPGWWRGAAFGLSEPALSTPALLMDMRRAELAIDAHRSETGSLPASLTEIAGIDDSLASDPWGNALVYVVDASGGSYELTSLGPDGVAGGGDDVMLDSLRATFASVEAQMRSALDSVERAVEQELNASP